MLGAQGAQRGARVEDLGRVDDLGAVREYGEQAEDQPEAVEEGRWTAERVGGGQAQPVADEARVVDDVAGMRSVFVIRYYSEFGAWGGGLLVGEHGGFGEARGAAGELEIAD